MYTHDEQTIVAQCTPKGSGALALIRISGATALTCAGRMSKLTSKKSFSELPSHTIHFGWIVDEQHNHLDQVLFLLMKAPATFTGQDSVEITCHNNQLLIEKIINEAIRCGARLAQEGEFTRRAYLNKKIDLTQAEAIDDLIHAQSYSALKKSLAQLEGTLSQQIVIIEEKIVQALAWCEANFEFLDEERDFSELIKTRLNELIEHISTLQKSFDLQKQIRQGVRIALIGSVNAGKSSLFNTLVQQKRAIVSAYAGTTRDTIESSVYHDGVAWTFVDTAGLRQTDNVIEQEGIIRSYAEAQQADLILLVYDGSHELSTQEQEIYTQLAQQYADKIIAVTTKVDLATNNISVMPNSIQVSTVTQRGVSELTNTISVKVATLLSAHQAPFLLNKRQYQLLTTVKERLENVRSLLGKTVQYELVAYHLKDTFEIMSELTGKSISEAALDKIFREFCVGK